MVMVRGSSLSVIILTIIWCKAFHKHSNIIAENAKEKQAKTYRSKQQRSADTARKNEMKRLEKEIDDFQMRIDSLTEEIAKEEVYTNYELMNAKCAEIDELKRKIEDNFDKLIELDSE